MLAEGYLAMTPDKYALLKLAQKSDMLLQGEQKFVVRETKQEISQQAGQHAPAASRRKSDILNSKGLELFERLRALRSEIAKQEGMPPYIIFSDKTLVDMCVRLPFTPEELLEVSGVGEHKLEKYGEPFLAELKSYTGGAKEKLYFGEVGDAAACLDAAALPSRARGARQKAEFFLTEDAAAQFPYAEKYLAPELAVKLNELRDEAAAKKTSGAEILRRSQQQGLSEERVVDGMRRKFVTKKGEEAGLFLGMRMSKKGVEYEDIYYGKPAQQMVVGWFTQ